MLSSLTNTTPPRAWSLLGGSHVLSTVVSDDCWRKGTGSQEFVALGPQGRPRASVGLGSTKTGCREPILLCASTSGWEALDQSREVEEEGREGGRLKGGKAAG